MYYYDVERDCPQADGYEPAGDWATSHDSIHDVKWMDVFVLHVRVHEGRCGI